MAGEEEVPAAEGVGDDVVGQGEDDMDLDTMLEEFEATYGKPSVDHSNQDMIAGEDEVMKNFDSNKGTDGKDAEWERINEDGNVNEPTKQGNEETMKSFQKKGNLPVQTWDKMDKAKMNEAINSIVSDVYKKLTESCKEEKCVKKEEPKKEVKKKETLQEAIDRIVKEEITKLDAWGKHPRYQQPAFQTPANKEVLAGTAEKDWNDDSTKGEEPYGKKIGSSAPFDKKVINQCDTYRLCSPNYASIFEFNLLKTGSITKFNVDCTYKPYSPYIHINPNWSKLYGEDYDDTRGLICQGDFSLPIINDQWINYQIQNKNYLNSFNRQIDSIELQNKYAKQSDIINASVGAVQGAMSGAAIGGVAGAVGGGLLSAAAGAQDVYINEKLRNDALDLTKDQFNYSLDNIKSLPNTLARVGAFDYNNKLFPILEYYSCSEQEKEIFKNKMLYNGMTIMRVDKINSFSIGNKNYVKGKLIRCETLDEATHEFNTIANELNKGAYF